MGDRRIPPLHITQLEVQALDHGGHAYTYDDWILRSFEFHERISQPYKLDLMIGSRDLDLRVPGLVGGRCRLRFGRGEFDRDVQGVVVRAESIGVVDEQLRARLRIGPSYELLKLSKRMRIFQDKTAIEIVQEILTPVLQQYGGTLEVDRLGEAKFRVRDYCVQFQETDFAFAQRLLAEEGVVYTFRHEGEAEAMVLMLRTAILHSTSGPDETEPQILPVSGRNYELAEQETVRRLGGASRMRPSQAEVSMWDWKVNPPTTVSGRKDEFEGDGILPPSLGRFGEVYEHEGYRPVEETEGGPLFEQVDLEAETLGHYYRAEDVRAQGDGNVVGFTDGATFELVQHPNADLDGFYVLLGVDHLAEFFDEATGTAGEAGSYENQFECLRYGGPHEDGEYLYVPERLPKPLAPGPITATVVGPASEDIHTDEHGRIKVRAHWDREGLARGDHETSCWVPVSQTWAGAGFGTVFIPRIGMEVVISFLAGDPDRPICTGVVYNGANTPPYPLPDHKTRSVIKTASSPNADGFNELSFEDAVDNEEIFLHAQKNLREVVKAAHTTTVGADQTITVTKDRRKTITGSDVTKVETDRVVRVDGAQEHHIEGSEATYVGGGATLGEDPQEVSEGTSSLRVMGQRYVWARDALVLEVGPEGGATTKVTLTPTGIDIVASSTFNITIGDKATFTMLPELQQSKAKEIVGMSENASIVLDKSATLSGKVDVTLAQAEGCFLKLDGDAALAATKVGLEAADALSANGTEVSVEASAKKVTINGTAGVAVDSPASVTLSAGGELTLKGTIVRGN